jgi:hypothetical protein
VTFGGWRRPRPGKWGSAARPPFARCHTLFLYLYLRSSVPVTFAFSLSSLQPTVIRPCSFWLEASAPGRGQACSLRIPTLKAIPVPASLLENPRWCGPTRQVWAPPHAAQQIIRGRRASQPHRHTTSVRSDSRIDAVAQTQCRSHPFVLGGSSPPVESYFGAELAHVNRIQLRRGLSV